LIRQGDADEHGELVLSDPEFFDEVRHEILTRVDWAISSTSVVVGEFDIFHSSISSDQA